MINIKSPNELKIMREAGKILSSVHKLASESFRIGISASELDQICYDAIVRFNAKPSFLGYRGFNYSVCVSKNHEIVHGLPSSDKLFLPGDICSLDIGVYYKGYHVDAARTLYLPPIDPEVSHLIDITEKSFFHCIQFAKPGNRLSDISHNLQNFAETNGLSVVRDLCSHGIGKSLHEDPLIPNYGKPGKGPLLKEGMTFAIEPMLNIGTHKILTLSDKWTIITQDKSFSAHYENTIHIAADGPEVLTL